MFGLKDDGFDDAERMLLTADRLERLAADLRTIHAGTGPSQRRLASAPVIDDWAFEFVPTQAIFGNVLDEETGRALAFFTTDLWVLAKEQGWVLTLAGLFRLGIPDRT
ncbi:DUF6634 family protein [Microvirga sp. P5_D2]